MHKLQKILLKRLQIQNNQRYGTLASGYDFEDNIVFHLNKLIADGLIKKTDRVYSITLNGVKEITKYEPVELDVKGIKTFFVGILCADENNNYLIKEHLNAKSNFYNLPSLKPFFGENINEALARAVKTYANIEIAPGAFTFLSIHMKTIQSSNGEVIFDDAFAIFSVEISNKLKAKMKLNNGARWMDIDEIQKLDNRWPEIDYCILQKDATVYRAYTHISDYIL